MQSYVEFPRERLSLCMIVRNEAEKLGRCLASAAPWVGEMIIVDTGSTDDTVAIAESFGAQVIHFPWCDDFAAARNAGLNHATRPWVLVLDADEELVVDLPDFLAACLQKDTPHRLHISVHNQGDHGAVSKAPIMRIFTRENPRAQFRSRIHEHLALVPGVPFTQAIVEGVWIRHDGYSERVRVSRDKVARNVALSRLQVADEPNDPHAWWCLATSLPAAESPEAAECFEKALELLGRGPAAQGPLLASTYALGATALVNSGQLARARKFLDQGLEDFPGYPDLLLQRGQVHLTLGNFELAAQDFWAAREERHQHYLLRLIDPLITVVAARVGRGQALKALGCEEEAEAEWLAAAPLATPRTASPFVALATLRMEQAAWSEALVFLEREMRRVPDDDAPRLLAVRCALEMGQLEQAWGLLRNCRESPVVRAYRAQIHLLRGQPTEALAAIENEDAAGVDALLGAWAYLCAGQAERSKAVWRSARQVAPDGPEAGLLPLVLHFFADEPASPEQGLMMPSLIEFVRGMRYLIRCQRFDELAMVIEKGRQLPPSLWHPVRINLGKQLAFDGFADVALELLVDALKDDPQQPEVLYWAGFAALQLNYMEDARTFWESCIGLEPNHALARQGLDMLPQPPMPLVS